MESVLFRAEQDTSVLCDEYLFINGDDAVSLIFYNAEPDSAVAYHGALVIAEDPVKPLFLNNIFQLFIKDLRVTFLKLFCCLVPLDRECDVGGNAVCIVASYPFFKQYEEAFETFRIIKACILPF